MRRATRLLIALVMLLTLQPTAAVAQEGPSRPPEPTSLPPVVWLRGPFGTVPNGDDGVLDAFVLSAPLRLETGDPDLTIGAWRASFRGLDGQPFIEFSGFGEAGVVSDGAILAAPDVPGTYRLEATAVLGSGAAVDASWTILVPDRPLPTDGLIEVPAPQVLLAGSSGSAAGWAGSGCYIYLCVDVGRLPPLRTVSHLNVMAGEQLRLRLSDGSAIAAWKVTLYPIVSGLQPAVDEIGDEPDAPVDGFTMEAPVAGEWLLQAEVTYDRLRGWTHAFYRLTSRAG
jgi:hypothetical protein